MKFDLPSCDVFRGRLVAEIETAMTPEAGDALAKKTESREAWKNPRGRSWRRRGYVSLAVTGRVWASIRGGTSMPSPQAERAGASDITFRNNACRLGVRQPPISLEPASASDPDDD